MYTTQNITQAQLGSIHIKNQNEIEELTGHKLELLKVWKTIKSISKNFTQKDSKAQEADALLYTILHPNKKGKKTTTSKEKIRLQEQERARSLDLLELELLIAA